MVQRTPAAVAPTADMSLRERKHLRMRQTIIEEATRLFEKKGYSNTTLKDIGDAAETSVATIMRYFTSKDGILLHKERSIVAELLSRVRSRFYRSLAEGVRDISRRSEVDLAERQRVYEIIHTDPEFISLLAAMRREWESLLEELYLQFSPKTREARLRAKSLALMQTAVGIAGAQFWHEEEPRRAYPLQRELIDEFIAAFVKPIDRAYAAQNTARRS